MFCAEKILSHNDLSTLHTHQPQSQRGAYCTGHHMTSDLVCYFSKSVDMLFEILTAIIDLCGELRVVMMRALAQRAENTRRIAVGGNWMIKL